MHVFVTGASGFIGKRLLPRLQADVRVVGKPYHYSPDRARRELGDVPTIDLREGVRRYFAEPHDTR